MFSKEKFQSVWKAQLINFCLNKYMLTFLIFLVYLTFFDKYNLINQLKLSRSLAVLELEKVEYQEELQKALLDQELLEKDIERFAREQYYIHKENEDIYIIERE